LDQCAIAEAAGWPWF